MYVLGFDKIVEAAIASEHLKKFGGNVENVERLFTEENLRKLEASHQGVFAFFAFHPQADRAVAEYVTGGSLGADSGGHVFALFTGESEPVFVSLAGDPATTRDRARTILHEAAAAWVGKQKDGGEFTTKFCVAMARAGVPYERIERRSMREWLAAAYRIASEHASTLVSVVKLFG